MKTEHELGQVELREVMDAEKHRDATQKASVILESDNLALTIQLDGHGVMGCIPGVGGQVLLEVYEGKPRLVVYADITQEDPTHIIDLDGANEKYRDDDDDESVSERILDSYGLKCPDCGLGITKLVQHEENCPNCKHVFMDPEQMDPSCMDPSCD